MINLPDGYLHPTHLQRYLPLKPVVIDAAAQDGTNTEILSHFCDHVHAFEPVPGLRRLIERRRLPNVSVWPYELSDRSSTADVDTVSLLAWLGVSETTVDGVWGIGFLALKTAGALDSVKAIVMEDDPDATEWLEAQKFVVKIKDGEKVLVAR